VVEAVDSKLVAVVEVWVVVVGGPE
jgi:hypothetical protein